MNDDGKFLPSAKDKHNGNILGKYNDRSTMFFILYLSP